MTQARLADGRVLNFPDGTDPAIIQQTVKRILSQAPQAPQVTPQAAPTVVAPIEAPTAPETPELAPGQRRPSALGQRAEGLSNLLTQASDFLTSADERTPELEALGEVGAAPELNDFTSINSLVTGAKLLVATSQKSIQGILEKNLDPDIPRNFREDEKGNLIVDLPSGTYALNKPGFSVQDIPEFAFQALAFSPAGRAAKGAGAVLKVADVATKSGLAASALELGEEALGGEEASIGDIAAATAFGGAGKVAEDVIGAGFRAIKGKIAPAEQAILDEAEKAGIRVLKSDILPPTTAAGKIAQSTAEKASILGTGPARAAQQKQRETAVKKIAEENQLFAFESVVEDLSNSRVAEKARLGEIFRQAGEKLDAVGDIPLPTTRANLAQVQAILDRPGIIQSENLKQQLRTLAGELDFPQTYTSVRENREAWTKILETIDNQGRSQFSSREDALFKQIRAGMTRDMKSFEKAHLPANEKRALDKNNKAFQAHERNFTRTKLKGILDKGDVTPEIVGNSLFTTNRSDVQRLFDNLTPTGQGNARAAFIGETVARLERKGGGLSPNAFQTEIRRFPGTVDVLFKGQQRRELDGLMKVLETTRRAQDATIATPTGQQVLGIAAAGGLFIDPVTTIGTAATIGAIAKGYESAPVRNALLRLANTPKGSTAFEGALETARRALVTAGQAAAREESAPQQ